MTVYHSFASRGWVIECGVEYVIRDGYFCSADRDRQRRTQTNCSAVLVNDIELSICH